MTTQDPGMRVLSERLSSVQRAREGFLFPMPEDGRLPPFGNGESVGKRTGMYFCTCEKVKLLGPQMIGDKNGAAEQDIYSPHPDMSIVEVDI